jgi:hypothetical protein
MRVNGHGPECVGSGMASHDKTTRRAAARMAGAGLLLFGAGRFALAAADFWNRKPPSAWSDEEITRLTTRSPWAKEVNAEFMHDTAYTTGAEAGPRIGVGGAISAPRDQSGGFEMGGDGRDRRGGARRAPVTVRWESAQPMREALGTPLRSEFKDRYVLSVSNLPIGVMESRRRKENNTGRPEADNSPAALQRRMIEQLKGAATLEARGKEPAQAGVVTSSPVPGTYLFGFSRELLPLGDDDKDVLFTLQTGSIAVKAKFEPKEMIYRGKPAL